MNFTYYITFRPAAKVNYLYILRLYQIAEYNKRTKLYDTISYKTQSELAKRLQVSDKTLARLLVNTEYAEIFTVDKKAKRITLLNNYRSSAERENKSFVRVNAACIDRLLAAYETLGEPNTDLFIRYYLYIRYYCTCRTSDFTGEQFLAAVGYSTNTGTRSKLCTYNRLLQE
jgi:hypothetical protein